jgi:TolB protein
MTMQNTRIRLLNYPAVLLAAVVVWSSAVWEATAADESPTTPSATWVLANWHRSAHVLGIIHPDGTGGDAIPSWSAESAELGLRPQFADGQRVLLTSYEDVDLKRVRSGQVKTRLDLQPGHRKLVEILQKNRPSDQMRTHALLPGDKRVIATSIVNGEERIFVMGLDGGEQVELTEAGGGFHYALSLSNDQKRLALHVTGGKPSFYNPGPYSINVLEIATKKRVLVAGQPGHLYFGPKWSPDDRWLVYMDCLNGSDPHHFAAALGIGRSEGSDHRLVTPPQSHWFGTPFGSNIPEWSPDGKTVTYTRLLPNSERDISKGGAQICLVDPFTGTITELTTAEEGRWDYRTVWSPDGKKMMFTRVRAGSPRELWSMDADGSHQKKLTLGYQKKGADFPRWIRVTAATK